jgi:hypothetical protein
VRLDDKELSELQLPRQPFRLRDNTCTGGTGLLAAYALTDLPIAMPGMRPFLAHTVSLMSCSSSTLPPMVQPESAVPRPVDELMQSVQHRHWVWHHAGDSLCMWDPSGGVLAAGRRPSSAGSGSSGQQPPLPPQGRKFKFVGESAVPATDHRLVVLSITRRVTLQTC